MSITIDFLDWHVGLGIQLKNGTTRTRDLWLDYQNWFSLGSENINSTGKISSNRLYVLASIYMSDSVVFLAIYKLK